MSCDLGSPAVDEAAETCEGASEGVRVGAALYVDMRAEARLPADCDLSVLDWGCGCVCVCDSDGDWGCGSDIVVVWCVGGSEGARQEGRREGAFEVVV